MQQNSRRESRSLVSVSVDDTDPRDPGASCDRCGVQGTVARASRSGPPALVLRYCSACWPAVQGELEDRQREEMDQWEVADRAWLALWERSPQGTRPAPLTQPVWTTASRSWFDVRRYLALPAEVPSAGAGLTPAQLAEIAEEIRSTANDMDGPIPSDVEDFLATSAEGGSGKKEEAGG